MSRSKSWPVNLGGALVYIGGGWKMVALDPARPAWLRLLLHLLIVLWPIERLGQWVLDHAPDESDADRLRAWNGWATFVSVLALLTLMTLGAVFLEEPECGIYPCQR